MHILICQGLNKGSNSFKVCLIYEHKIIPPLHQKETRVLAPTDGRTKVFQEVLADLKSDTRICSALRDHCLFLSQTICPEVVFVFVFVCLTG